MKRLIITIAFLSFNVQAKPFLSLEQADKASEYLNYICMDTFCGGDYNWTSAQVSCDEESCTLQMNAMSWYDDELEIGPETFEALPEDLKVDGNIRLTGAQIVDSGLYTDKFEGTQFTTECKFSIKSNNQTLSYAQKEEIVYAETLDCVSDLTHLLDGLDIRI
ncbi:MAG: hypothetical protein ACJAS4_001263 [Bacteriovoracaceae bacterium]|jgi:hypothetical protein